MKPKVKIAQFGLGPIGVECLRLAASKSWMTVVGAVDKDPKKTGQDLASFTAIPELGRLRIVESLDYLSEQPDLVFHTAVSQFSVACPDLALMGRRGTCVVSSCEELIFPALREPELAAELNRVCVASGARIVGTGVNPGFVMDLLPLFISSVAREVRAIHVERVVDASTRREPLQRKIGSGLPPEEFRAQLRSGRAGHAGLRESLALIAHGLEWELGEIEETGEPIVASTPIRTAYLEVGKGQTCGIHQRVESVGKRGTRLTLDLKMCLGAEDPHDLIRIEGEPSLELEFNGGVPGDGATVAALVNTVPKLLRAEPGLRLLTDLSIV